MNMNIPLYFRRSLCYFRAPDFEKDKREILLLTPQQLRDFPLVCYFLFPSFVQYTLDYPNSTPLLPKQHTLITQTAHPYYPNSTPLLPKQHTLITQTAHPYYPNSTPLLPKQHTLITQTAHP